jgi:hypothetical protein
VPLAVTWYWRRLVASAWLRPPQPPLCSRRPPFVVKQPDDSELRSKWRVRWSITLGVTVFILTTFHSMEAARTWSHDSQGMEPSYWVVFWYNIFGALFVVPWSECLGDALSGAAFLVARHQQKPLPNSRPNWLKERWLLSMCLWLLCTVAGLNTAYFWGDGTAPLVEVEVPLAKLPLCMDGLRVFLISDTHAGPLVSEDEIEQIVQLANSLEPPIDIGARHYCLPRPSVPSYQYHTLGVESIFERAVQSSVECQV